MSDQSDQSSPSWPQNPRGTTRTAWYVGVAILVIGAVIGVSVALASNAKTPSTALNQRSVTTTTQILVTPTTTPAVSSDAAEQTAANQRAVAAGCPSSPSTRVNTLSWPSAPAMTIDTAASYYAHVATTAGTFVIKLNATGTPITVNNFVFLAKQGFFNCVIFHRVIPGFVIQGGDPTGTGEGGPGYTIPDELPLTATPQYPLYSVAMANEGSAHTGGSQFFIVTGASGESLSPTYTLFGQVVAGLSVISTINSEGNPSNDSGGVPPLVTQRMLRVTINNQE